MIVGPVDAVANAVNALGRRAHTHLAYDREAVDCRRVLLSRPKLLGSSGAELDTAGRNGGIVTRVRRGDVGLLGLVSLPLGSVRSRSGWRPDR